MKPIKFKECNTTYGKGQVEYGELPALRFENGDVCTCWKLSWKDVLKAIWTRKIWIGVATFNNPIQPICVTVNSNELFVSNNELEQEERE